ncbi:MAG: hypothetical protein KAT65_19230 [Methanophagales archaeon]|nr:hypothetical protein [Methanophagales archaeon]
MAKNEKKRFLGVGVGLIAATGILTIAILLAFAALGSGGGAAIDRNAEGNGGEVTIAASEVTTSINYQGRLTDSAGNLLNGTYTMTFKLYEVASGGTALATYTNRVEVTDGLFNTNIDFDQSYFDGRALWLGITVGSDYEMTPRQELLPVPYAFHADDAETLDGMDSAAFATKSELSKPGAINTENNPIDWTKLKNVPDSFADGVDDAGAGDGHSLDAADGDPVDAIYVDNDGNVGIGTTSPSTKLHVVNSDCPIAGLFETTKSDGNTNALQAVADAENTGDNKGLYIAVRNNGAGNAYSIHSHGKDAVMYHEGNVGIGTKNPEHKLHVVGTNNYIEGVHVDTSGDNSDGVCASTTGYDSEGFLAVTTGDYSDGFAASTSGEDSDGFRAETYGDESQGLHTHTEGDYSEGVYALTTGYDSDGVQVDTTGDKSEGVYVGTSGKDSDGFSAETFGHESEGLVVRVHGDGSEGVSVYSDKSYAIFAHTYRSDQKYGVYTPDYMYAAKYEGGGGDVAEYFAVDEDAEPGTVMVVDPAGGSKLRCSTTAYDTTVAGIVSNSSGVSLGVTEEGNEGEKLIAVAGHVPCKVDASFAPIKPGDLLTTSDISGYAMKASNPQIGTILGKALEPLDSGRGVIEVLVTLQ